MKKILIADDSVLNRMLLKQNILEAAPGTEIREVAYGDEALRALRTFTPDLVLLDLDMPGMDGLETAAAIHLRFPATRIALVAGKEQVDLQERVRQSAVPFVGLIEKPLTTHQHAQIAHLLNL